ncbi:ribonuclease D [Parvularcula lutaonensis]|uniref:Ribonuclease D n=1 Tax=Parvularcula lutaonensis TaxID=491923 RepID=A0ABV7MB71_9PROT|nr:ribonuclease D [Parvularcula lutaonensis]GGY39586.1 ribonuclease D [Parvularcula lutaonensis]
MIPVLTKTEDITAFSERARKAEYVTVDTEFLREKTYYAQLCLIQAATPDEAVIIDPLAEGVSLEGFFQLLRDEEVVKVFHAARQDLEIFVHLMGELPTPLFDTQIAAMVFGFGDQVGYEPLVRELTGKQIDKGSRFTDWSRRPLSEKQLNYALGDVTHLRDVFENLLQRLRETRRHAWVEEEMAALSDPSLYVVKPEEAWQRLKMRNVKPKELGPIIEIARWREAEAQRKNVPRARIIKDEVIFEVARALPSSAGELGNLRSVPNGFERSAAGKGLLDAVARGREIPRDALPRIEKRQREPGPPDVVDLLRVLLKRQCEAHNVAPKLLASASDLDALALDDNADIPALRGWRREVFGDMALRLKRGELALGLEGKRVSVVDRSSS